MLNNSILDFHKAERIAISKTIRDFGVEPTEEILALYHTINKRSDAWCERVFSPWVDMADAMREQKIPLFALESQDPIKDFDYKTLNKLFRKYY